MLKTPNGEGEHPTCPACDTRVPWERIRLTQPFSCANCGALLRARRSYAQLIVLASLLISGGFGYLIGGGGLFVAVFTAITFIPVGIVLMLLVHRRVQPHVKLNVLNE